MWVCAIWCRLIQLKGNVLVRIKIETTLGLIWETANIVDACYCSGWHLLQSLILFIWLVFFSWQEGSMCDGAVSLGKTPSFTTAAQICNCNCQRTDGEGVWWQREDATLRFSSSQLPTITAASASPPAEDPETLTGGITGHDCQSWQTGNRLPPNVHHETQITTEEWQKEEEEEELCGRQDALL